jgi:hypothetical protein
MSERDLPAADEGLDRTAFEPGYGTGGVPWYLMVGYIAFLVFFTWYVLEFQLPDFLRQGPGQSEQVEAPAGD